ncbi:uncharacterized protein LOC135843575 [Planococcus citri]|uniref:uncharacterized protein LOC135843575 n=1 Tax=Planococcus citri TaxID=170843 RepID=UPI0031F886E9
MTVTTATSTVTTSTATPTVTTASITAPIMHSTFRVLLNDFIPADPNLWFTLTDRQFQAHSITNPDEKLGFILAKLPHEVLSRASDILASKEAADIVLAKLTKRINSLYHVSSEERLDELLKNCSLGTKKPLVLLAEMRILAGPASNEELLQRLWMRRLPVRMQEHLAAHNVSLEALGQIADSLHSVMLNTGQISSLTPSADLTMQQFSQMPSTSFATQQFAPILPTSQFSSVPSTSQFSPIPPNSVIERLEQQIAALSAQIAAIASSSRPSRERSRSRSEGPRDRSRSRSQSRSANHPYCWYHFKFGMDAKKCTPPCKFVSLNSTGKPENQ